MTTAELPAVVANWEDNPYPGLRPFEREDVDVFFGREIQIDELLARLARHRFVALVGPSGCGKSSLTRAGLIPALLDGMLGDTGMNWAIAIMRPGGQPEVALRECLLPLLPAPAIAEAPPRELASTDDEPRSGSTRFNHARFYLEQALDGSRDALSRAAAQLVLASEAKNVLLLVDQFEEIFRFNRRPGDDAEWFERSSPFVQQLLAAVNDPTSSPRGNIYVVLTMRDEFVGRCAMFPGLAEALNQGLYLVPRLTRAQLADAVRLPAKTRGRVVSPGLAERVVNDSISAQDELPVLEHAMMRTWLTLPKETSEVSLAAYEGVGAVQGALNAHGDEIIGLNQDGTRNDKLTGEQFRLCEVIFKRLTLDAEEGATRAPASVQELANVAGVTPENKDLQKVLNLFRAPDCQFLSPSPKVQPELEPDTEIDLTHEAILRTWLKLKHWAADERRDSVLYRRLLEMALQFEKASDSSSPLREPQLSSVLKWWEEHQPTPAWAARYHPAPARLQQDGFEHYVESRGTRKLPKHAALHERAWQFLAAARDERDAALEKQDQERVAALQKEDAAHLQRQAALRQRLLNYVLGPALLIFGIAVTLALFADRTKSEALQSELAARKLETQAKDREIDAARQVAAAAEEARQAAEKAKQAAVDALAAQRALGVAEGELKKKILQLQDAERKATEEARVARQNAAAARREADAATGELGKLAPLKERNRELERQMTILKAENTKLYQLATPSSRP
ncbi:MAG TPA: hypothetical protein VJV79_19415 [Polyangiaceae bacterium]|nr:hypothetical protein [Polyangiaceae bacterium]